MKSSIVTASGLFVLTIFMVASLLSAGMSATGDTVPATAHAAAVQ